MPIQDEGSTDHHYGLFIEKCAIALFRKLEIIIVVAHYLLVKLVVKEYIYKRGVVQLVRDR